MTYLASLAVEICFSESNTFARNDGALLFSTFSKRSILYLQNNCLITYTI